MEKYIFVLLTFSSLVAASQFIVDRREGRDIFVWSGVRISCTKFSQSTATSNGSNGCVCNDKLTFSTESNQCQSYRNQGMYQRTGAGADEYKFIVHDLVKLDLLHA